MRNKGFAPIVVVVIIAVLVTVGFFYIRQTNNSTPGISPSPTAKISTVGWKTYKDKNLTFMYPPDWTLANFKIVGVDRKIMIDIVGDNSLFNECMEVASIKIEDGLVIKKFRGVGSNESQMCLDKNKSSRQIWITPSGNNNSQVPGINYTYSTDNEIEALGIFDQILTSFKFTK